MRINNLTEYRKSKVIVKDLEKVLTTLNAAISALKPYGKYRPVNISLTALLDNKDLVQLYLEKYRIILETKGAQ